MNDRTPPTDGWVLTAAGMPAGVPGGDVPAEVPGLIPAALRSNKIR